MFIVLHEPAIGNNFLIRLYNEYMTTHGENHVQIRETKNASIACPHCERNISVINAQKIKSTFGVRFVYFCDSCKKVLGISHRKGFFMG